MTDAKKSRRPAPKVLIPVGLLLVIGSAAGLTLIDGGAFISVVFALVGVVGLAIMFQGLRGIGRNRKL